MIKQVNIRNFGCLSLSIKHFSDSGLVVVTGERGSGKTLLGKALFWGFSAHMADASGTNSLKRPGLIPTVQFVTDTTTYEHRIVARNAVRIIPTAAGYNEPTSQDNRKGVEPASAFERSPMMLGCLHIWTSNTIFQNYVNCTIMRRKLITALLIGGTMMEKRAARAKALGDAVKKQINMTQYRKLDHQRKLRTFQQAIRLAYDKVDRAKATASTGGEGLSIAEAAFKIQLEAKRACETRIADVDKEIEALERQHKIYKFWHTAYGSAIPAKRLNHICKCLNARLWMYLWQLRPPIQIEFTHHGAAIVLSPPPDRFNHTDRVCIQFASAFALADVVGENDHVAYYDVASDLSMMDGETLDRLGAMLKRLAKRRGTIFVVAPESELWDSADTVLDMGKTKGETYDRHHRPPIIPPRGHGEGR
ncbi:MAG: hypothetical protein JRI80_00265 [Deltaproteobacteria bacterium]|nr:hypothetical protein [Deltaproteobacteria bacterium]